MRIAVDSGDRRYGGFEMHTSLVRVRRTTPEDVRITFVFGHGNQRDAVVEIPVALARWLAGALLAAGEGPSLATVGLDRQALVQPRPDLEKLPEPQL